MTPDIELTSQDGVQTIRFARAAKKNAITRDMYTAMTAALTEGDADSAISAHVFLGHPGVFTAGNDLADFMSAAVNPGGGVLGGPVMDFLRLLPRVKKPMLAAIDGIAIGIGTTLLMHCDLVYATPASQLQTPFLDLGLVPEAGSSFLAPRIMGHQRAFEMLVLGQPFTAERAMAAGLINTIVEADALEATAFAAARRLAKKPPRALEASRRLLKGDPSAVLAAIEDEAALFAKQLASQEAQAAFAAFFAKGKS